jgi:hypothetical protein
MQLSLQAPDLVAPEQMNSLPDQVEESRPEFFTGPADEGRFAYDVLHELV